MKETTTHENEEKTEEAKTQDSIHVVSIHDLGDYPSEITPAKFALALALSVGLSALAGHYIAKGVCAVVFDM